MKKVLLTKITPQINRNVVATNKIMQVTKMASSLGITNTTYQQRKSCESIFKELFRVLLLLPDKAVQQRVVSAINNEYSICKKCSSKAIVEYKEESTQTEQINCMKIKENILKTNIINTDNLPGKIMSQQTPLAIAIEEVDKKTNDDDKSLPHKRGRKRKNCGPTAAKHSHTLQILKEREDKQLTRIPIKKRNVAVNGYNVRQIKNLPQSELKDFKFLRDLANCDLSLDSSPEVVSIETHIYKTMLNAYKQSEKKENGLLPLHQAVLTNDRHHLQRQIYVWTKLKFRDLNDILTNEDEDCLELAIINDCLPSIIKILLEANLSPNQIYMQSNSVIHLAVLNNIDLISLKLLMDRIDLNLLLRLNDNGYTPLHIALRHNQFQHAEIICDVIDQRLLGETLCKRQSAVINDEKHDDDNYMMDESHFKKYYEEFCDRYLYNLAPQDFINTKFKRQLLDCGEQRGGNTALFYAIENEMEHFTYFLLAHLCNPVAENHSGQSAKSFHYEFARSLKINLKVSRLMSRVTEKLELFEGKQQIRK